MPIYGTCKRCRGETVDYCCPACTEDRLERIAEAIEKIVVTEGEDAGVILLSADSPTRYDPELKCQVYIHEHFSPLGDALVHLYKLATERC